MPRSVARITTRSCVPVSVHNVAPLPAERHLQLPRRHLCPLQARGLLLDTYTEDFALLPALACNKRRSAQPHVGSRFLGRTASGPPSTLPTDFLLVRFSPHLLQQHDDCGGGRRQPEELMRVAGGDADVLVSSKGQTNHYLQTSIQIITRLQIMTCSKHLEEFDSNTRPGGPPLPARDQTSRRPPHPRSTQCPPPGCPR